MILYTSVTEYLNKQKKYYLILSIIILIFSIIYECFSHGVYSIYMCTSFLIPFILGFIVTIILKMKYKKTTIKPIVWYNSSVVVLLTYFILRGILDIYGTTNNLINIYLYAYIILLFISAVVYFKRK